jgi:hypothetical protein
MVLGVGLREAESFERRILEARNSLASPLGLR